MTTNLAAPSRPRPLPWTQLIGAPAVAAASAALWFAWMGWDSQYQIDPVTGAASGPYEVWQVAGCVGSLLVVLVSALLAGVRAWLAAPAMTVAFTAAWTATMAPADDSGLYGVGMILLFMGLAAATTVVSLASLGLRAVVMR